MHISVLYPELGSLCHSTKNINVVSTYLFQPKQCQLFKVITKQKSILARLNFVLQSLSCPSMPCACCSPNYAAGTSQQGPITHSRSQRYTHSSSSRHCTQSQTNTVTITCLISLSYIHKVPLPALFVLPEHTAPPVLFGFLL